MISWFLWRWIDKFERTWNYDASYMRELLSDDRAPSWPSARFKAW